MSDKNKDDQELDALYERYGMKTAKAPEKKPAPKVEVPVEESVSPKEEVVASEPDFRGNALIEAQERMEEEQRNKPPENVLERNRGLAETGAVLGGAAQYKGVGRDLLRPNPELFALRDASQMGGQKAPLIPTATAPVTDIEHVMQSGQEVRPQVTGRQKESGHNWETNRQAMAQQQGLKTQGASNVIVEAGPMYPTKGGIAIPQSVAVQLEQELQAKQMRDAMIREELLKRQLAEQQRIQQQQANRAKVVGGAKGVARMGQGVVGGAFAAPQLYEYARDVIAGVPSKPADTTQGLSGLGGLMMALGKGRTGAVGALAQIPYAIKHRDEIARSLNLADIVPDTIRMGMTGSELYEPADTMPVRPTPIR